MNRYLCFVTWCDYPGSSGSIVSGYELDDRAIDVRSPAEARDFSSTLSVQTGSRVHPASCPMGTGGPFPGLKRGLGVTLTTHPHLVPRSRSRMSRSHTPLPPSAFMACSGTALAFSYVVLRRPTSTFLHGLKPFQTLQILFCRRITRATHDASESSRWLEQHLTCFHKAAQSPCHGQITSESR
jgi:hypothetical protein